MSPTLTAPKNFASGAMVLKLVFLSSPALFILGKTSEKGKNIFFDAMGGGCFHEGLGPEGPEIGDPPTIFEKNEF